MQEAISLDRLALNQGARIKTIHFHEKERRRMLDLGFREGSVVRPVLRSPSGSPTAYQVCGALIALRSSESERISVLPLQADGGAF
ncbi:MAG: ferrous iron transport protein A [Provencibacterium sp.]|jgi:ferrous iron transport protein A|nr:ferrous iron transport protein A [Provencibacterium sp.]